MLLRIPNIGNGYGGAFHIQATCGKIAKGMRKRKSILIVGGNGFVGTHLCLGLRDRYKVFCTYHKTHIHMPGVTSLPMDILNRDRVKRIAYTVEPDVVIYAAGKNDVIWAEQNERTAENLHSGGPSSVATVVDIFKPRYILLSNCYVYDGNYGNYSETDTPLPSTMLGRAKLNGENYIRSRSWNHVVIRSSPVFGHGNGIHLSDLDHYRMRLSRKERIEVSTQTLLNFAPVSQLVQLVQRLIDGGPRNKVLNFGGLTKLTQFDFVKAYAKRFGFDENLIYPLRSQQAVIKKFGSESDSGRESTYDYSLNCSGASKIMNIKPLLLEEGFDLLEKELVPTLG